MENFVKIITLAGAFLAFLIGSGVATGQEIMQYYSPYGFKVIGTAITIAIILIIANYGFAYAGKKGDITKGSEVFNFYCGPIAGRAFDLFTVFFCYMSYVVMVSGAASTLQQQYGFPLIVGAILIVVLAGTTVAFGLNSIVDIIGKIGPTLVTMIFIMSSVSLIMNAGRIPANIAAIDSGSLAVTKAGANWFLSGASNGGFCILWLAGFTTALGIKEDFKTLMKANILSSIVLVVVNSIIGFAILAKIDAVGSLQIPNLYLASELWAPLAYIFGILIFAAIYTTACPLLWTASSRFATEGTSKFRILTAVLAVIGLLIALYVPFNVLMNYIYVINGYLGFIVLAIMIIRMIIIISNDKKNKQIAR
ncbi:YkvI family membrane protein [Lutispora saccharofermentans]|uniref:Membrane protein YkvI n=1 Tax=Lutispora saccharofermentans TaxID=3024236 RepID=A0ABT1NHH0_9FIRM|nr:hypothetical protein [Lutispora saccharofermentans]MCQ1530684.1 hypothetical protein [Lutispora saccharofermentans]